MILTHIILMKFLAGATPVESSGFETGHAIARGITQSISGGSAIARPIA